MTHPALRSPVPRLLHKPTTLILAGFALLFANTADLRAESTARGVPNILFILADDLGSAELGCYGQKKIRTPRIDQLAAEGLRFTQFYSGNAVCAPARCGLMTGKHMGHAIVRDNREQKPEGQFPLPAETVTIAELLKARGYATAAIGKWGLGPPGSEGDPNKQGFDLFYGCNCQRHAHNHYPTYVWKNDQRVELEGNTNGVTGKQFTHDLMEAEALAFIRANRQQPFFLYVPFLVPHVAIQVPEDSLAEYQGKLDDAPYDGKQGYKPHPAPHAGYAAMVTRLDRSVGRIVDLLAELKLDENTLVLFTSDNGPTHGRVGGADSEFFESAGGLRGLKGSLYEGGIRVPLIARQPGKIKPGVNATPGVFYDFLPTLCEVAGADARSAKSDGVSLAPVLFGGQTPQREFLYWEFPGYGGQQAVRMGNWKGVRQQLGKGKTAIELYDLQADPAEQTNLAEKRPEIVAKIAAIMQREHTPSLDFPLQTIDQAK